MLTAEEFADRKFDLPEGGRWHELVSGELNQFDPPEVVHGNIILNLSKALAEHLTPDNPAYACFELGLVVCRDPDTVRCPPVSLFVEGERFAEMDKQVTETRPALVIEIAASNARRAEMADRIGEFHDWGVGLVWVIDPEGRCVHVAPRGHNRQVVVAAEMLWGRPLLPGFGIRVDELFADPDWWSGGNQSRQDTDESQSQS